MGHKADINFHISERKIQTRHILKGDMFMKYEIPIWEKSNLSLEEAAGYFNIGINKLRELTDSENCPFVLWCGNKRLIKRKAFDKYLEKIYSI